MTQDKSTAVKTMFAGIARRYDLANVVLSVGIYRFWYNRLIKLSRAKPEMRVLDCATGTGSLAIDFYVAKNGSVSVTGVDFTPEMLQLAKQKAEAYNLNIRFEEGDALDLNFPASSFDISTIAFGIRNVNSVEKCLTEMARVVKPKGKVMVLEFGQPYALFRPLFRFYSRFVMPLLGKILTGDKNAYQYLVETSAKFPCRQEFIKIMESTGAFSKCRFFPLTFGVAYIYIGEVAG